MNRIYVTIDFADKNFSAGSGQINGLVIATGKSLDEVKQKFEEAFLFHIEGSISDGDDLPEWVIKQDYFFEFKLSISALLQHFDGILTRSALSRITGINERQLGHYATGHRKPRLEQRKKIIDGFHKLGEQFSSVV